MEDKAAADLVQEIEAVFLKTPMPFETNLITSRQSDEEAEYALTFRGLEWHKIHPDLLVECVEALNFFTAEALRYYVPAFMRAHLYGYHDADAVFTLTHGFYKDEKIDALMSKYPVNKFDSEKYAREQLSLFSREERIVIIAYLRYIAQNDIYEKNAVDQALENYWLK